MISNMHVKGINNIYVTLTNDRQDYLVSPTADRKIRGTVGKRKKKSISSFCSWADKCELLKAQCVASHGKTDYCKQR